MINAVLYSDVPPNPEQERRFKTFLETKYGPEVSLQWIEDLSLQGGFKLIVGAEVYDWSREGVFRQFTEALGRKKYLGTNTIPLLKEALEEWELNALPQERGTVLTVGDGIAEIDGLKNVAYGEIVLFDNGIRGMVQSLKENSVGCIIFDADEEILAGSTVRRTGMTASMPVGDAFLGRVVDRVQHRISVHNV